MICAHPNCDRRVPPKKTGGGIPKRFCSENCQEAAWRLKVYDKRKDQLLAGKRRAYAEDPKQRERTLARNDFNRRIRTRRAKQTKRAAQSGVTNTPTIKDGVEPSECALTFGQWQKERGFDPDTRTYVAS